MYNGLRCQRRGVETIKTRRHKELIALIRAARINAGLRQQDVAERCNGRSQQWVAAIESGQRRIDVIEYLMLADAIGFNPHTLLAKVAKISK